MDKKFNLCDEVWVINSDSIPQKGYISSIHEYVVDFWFTEVTTDILNFSSKIEYSINNIDGIYTRVYSTREELVDAILNNKPTHKQ